MSWTRTIILPACALGHTSLGVGRARIFHRAAARGHRDHVWGK